MPKKLSPFVVFIILGVVLAVVIIGFFYKRSMTNTTPKPSSEVQLVTSTLGKLSLHHPKSYVPGEKDRDGRKVFILEKTGSNVKMAVFKKSDFKNDQPTWLFPEMSENSGEYLPLDYTEAMPVGGDDGYMVWMYYDKSDSAGKSELYKIFETIRYN
jgi:hypothetical protein